MVELLPDPPLAVPFAEFIPTPPDATPPAPAPEIVEVMVELLDVKMVTRAPVPEAGGEVVALPPEPDEDSEIVAVEVPEAVVAVTVATEVPPDAAANWDKASALERRSTNSPIFKTYRRKLSCQSRRRSAGRWVGKLGLCSHEFRIGSSGWHRGRRHRFGICNRVKWLDRACW